MLLASTSRVVALPTELSLLAYSMIHTSAALQANKSFGLKGGDGGKRVKGNYSHQPSRTRFEPKGIRERTSEGKPSSTPERERPTFGRGRDRDASQRTEFKGKFSRDRYDGGERAGSRESWSDGKGRRGEFSQQRSFTKSWSKGGEGKRNHHFREHQDSMLYCYIFSLTQHSSLRATFTNTSCR
ncbi:hypothetical protein BXZ70DRAFT_485931 [Cristinia sonorae]|uniref:Uncharacterized protein n=1 Tax=Cristinia sonorae TaxID=1940300 RepID=A0A8K0UGU8_9AGAR|nr:hypothetical protein BXZ70DRAFT_485931 [Cristinia sonorae]